MDEIATKEGGVERELVGEAALRPETGSLRRETFASRLYARILNFLLSPLPWTGTEPFRWLVAVGLGVPAAVLGIEAVIYPDTRLQVYTTEVAVVFLLGFVVLEGEKVRRLASRATRLDLGLALGTASGLVLWNLGLGAFTGYVASPHPGFADATVLILAGFLGLYGLRNFRSMAAPISLLLVFVGITVFISNDDPVFYAYVGRYFVQWNVWMSASLLGLLGHTSVAGPDYFQLTGPPSLRIEMWLRCSGLDVACLYSVLIGNFAWQAHLSVRLRTATIATMVGGAFLLNSLRVVGLTILFLNYPPSFVEAIHTNLGDLIFLGYALGFIVALRRFR